MKKLQELSREEAIKAALVILGVAILAVLAFYLIFFEEVLSPNPELPEKEERPKTTDNLQDAITPPGESQFSEEAIEKLKENITPPSDSGISPTSVPDKESNRSQQLYKNLSAPGAEE